MKGSRVEVVLLCEDEQTACFGRRFLRERGFQNRQLRELVAPAGKGSGEQWVRESLPGELRALRSARSRALIVLTDADTITVEKRKKTLEVKCSEEKVPWRGPQEPVMVLVPARNIETWLAYLRGETVDESRVYPKYKAEADCREQARALAAMCEAGKLREPDPASLVDACEEWRRLG